MNAQIELPSLRDEVMAILLRQCPALSRGRRANAREDGHKKYCPRTKNTVIANEVRQSHPDKVQNPDRGANAREDGHKTAVIASEVRQSHPDKVQNPDRGANAREDGHKTAVIANEVRQSHPDKVQKLDRRAAAREDSKGGGGDLTVPRLNNHIKYQVSSIKYQTPHHTTHNTTQAHTKTKPYNIPYTI
jgi:hypothetical protein